jgi:hypothetical protein
MHLIECRFKLLTVEFVGFTRALIGEGLISLTERTVDEWVELLRVAVHDALY